jgi:hypothetical protein
LQAHGYYLRTRVLELRHEVQKRDGVEDSINHFDLRACHHTEHRNQAGDAIGRRGGQKALDNYSGRRNGSGLVVRYFSNRD